MLELAGISKKLGNKSVLDQISFTLKPGRSLAIVGESGCGKSTLARIILSLEQPSSGSVIFQGNPAPVKGTSNFKQWYRQIQIVFQNNAASLDPRMTILQSLEEPLRHYTRLNCAARRKRSTEYAAITGFPVELLEVRPGQLSGGQYQRACIARALIVQPKLLVCDEIVSNLDSIHQAKIIALLKKLQREHQLTLIFITHDLALVPSLCQDVIVMREGRIMEQFETAGMDNMQHHPYTQSLLDAAHQLTYKWISLTSCLPLLHSSK
jgi:ABC-type glutathione transport system ATPase component